MKIERLQTIIDNAKLDDSIKDVLKRTMKELCNYNEDILEGIKEKVLAPKAENEIGEIVCALLSKEEKAPSILSPLQESSSNFVFIDADYEEMCRIVGENETEKYYEGIYWENGEQKTFHYQFKFNNIFLKAQELLFSLDKYYTMNHSILFCPFCHKAFYMIPKENELPSKIDKIDYCFAKQNIPVIENATLFWNLHIEKTDVIPCIGKAPYGEEQKYKYIIEESNENWYFVLPENKQTLIYDIQFTEKGTEIWLNCSSESFILIEYNSVNWEQIKGNRIFSNKLEKNLFTKRICTLGDIEHALFSFRNNMGIICQRAEKLDKICMRYSAKYRNYFQRISYHYLKRVYIQFYNHKEFDYIEDYINYVLFYLEYHYPEIEWVGGK